MRLRLILDLFLGSIEPGDHLADLAEHRGTLFRLAGERHVAGRYRAHSKALHAGNVGIDLGDQLGCGEHVGNERILLLRNPTLLRDHIVVLFLADAATDRGDRGERHECLSHACSLKRLMTTGTS